MATKGTGSNKLLFFMIVLTVVLVTGAVANFFFFTRYAVQDNAFLNYVSEQAVLSQSLTKNAVLAVADGNRNAFSEMGTNVDNFDKALNAISEGEPPTLPAAKGDVASEVGVMQARWNTMEKNIRKIMDHKEDILIGHTQADAVNRLMPQLMAQLDDLSKLLSEQNAPRSQIYHVSRQGLFGQRILRDMNTLLGTSGNAAEAANRLIGDTSYLGRVMKALYDGDPKLDIAPVSGSEARAKLDDAMATYRQMENALQTLTSIAPDLVDAANARDAVKQVSDQLLASVRTVERTYQRAADKRLFKDTYGYAFGGAALVVIIAMIYLFVLTSDTRKAAALQVEQQERNQEAILRLLDELGSLADGDLTVQATVTEDITGAIADSINYAIEALRDLVVTINDTALQVDSTARQTQATASNLLEATENQTQQISSATKQITQMASSVEQVSANAERSTKVAQQSVEIAHKGGEAVRATIDGMNSIRETIQETSKRIKRLGESSQEIGDIVELINDIAEQTNILALNAAIQASMAGEAGRGFAVVADEVQRLAERSANATRQIEALVKTIQTDTNEAVISMEQSTAGVVNGAQLAENAGSSLDEIEKVSNHIATLIQSISSAARQQAAAATDVSRTMRVIQDITVQTAEGTRATAANIGKLANLGGELRKSVAGFKLPGMDAGETMVMTADDVEARGHAPAADDGLSAEAHAGGGEDYEEEMTVTGDETEYDERA